MDPFLFVVSYLVVYSYAVHQRLQQVALRIEKVRRLPPPPEKYAKTHTKSVRSLGVNTLVERCEKAVETEEFEGEDRRTLGKKAARSPESRHCDMASDFLSKWKIAGEKLVALMELTKEPGKRRIAAETEANDSSEQGSADKKGALFLSTPPSLLEPTSDTTIDLPAQPSPPRELP